MLFTDFPHQEFRKRFGSEIEAMIESPGPMQKDMTPSYMRTASTCFSKARYRKPPQARSREPESPQDRRETYLKYFMECYSRPYNSQALLPYYPNPSGWLSKLWSLLGPYYNTSPII